MNAHGGIDCVLTDSLDHGLLTDEIKARMTALARESNPRPVWRNAIVTRSIVNQAQARQDCLEDDIRLFRSVEAACTRLFSEEA